MVNIKDSQHERTQQWQIQPTAQVPEWLWQAVKQYLPEARQFAAQLLWQRGIRQPAQVSCFIDAKQYQPTSPFAFGQEMQWAVARLQQARQTAEKVAIWGDFDADGVTATAVLWEGLGEFFAADRLTYFIPNRLTDSHGLAEAGMAALADQGYSLLITCDTGSGSLAEIQYAQSLGIDLIITDHHTLPNQRPPVAAMLNPRTLPADHPLANLSGVAVAYKLVEALYETLPEVAQRPLSNLLDLVAIGLIADLVDLTGDCRYLAQVGIAQLQKNQDPIDPPRPGIAKLLELCRRSGDRPTDISFGIGPRINAISRIQGDARFCIELLTSRDRERCHQLALETELANARRKGLQRQVAQQVKQKLAQLDLSTTSVIVLADSQWSVGILGLIAGQIAQEYGRPTILLSTEASTEASETAAHPQLARGSARSVNQIDLYALLQQQADLLHRFGGHPFAAGLSLPVENIPLFTQAVNQQLRSTVETSAKSLIQADLTITVADLTLDSGKSLFQELKLLEPYGMGNPVPKLLIQNCWFTQSWHRKIRDLSGRKLEYVKTEFQICDDSSEQGFPGVWWGHYKDELPLGRCDVIAELDFNSYEDAKRQKGYEIRLVALRACDGSQLNGLAADQLIEPLILDWRGQIRATTPAAASDLAVLPLTHCPSSWQELQAWLHIAQQSQRQLALAYDAPAVEPPLAIWQQLVGIAQSSQNRVSLTHQQLQETLQIGEHSLKIGLETLKQLGFIWSESQFQPVNQSAADASDLASLAAETIAAPFIQALQEEQFMQQYFYQVPLNTLQAAIQQRNQLE